MARGGHQSVEAYLADQPPAARKALTQVRAIIRKTLPRATEGISYQIPVYKLDGAMVLYPIEATSSSTKGDAGARVSSSHVPT